MPGPKKKGSLRKAVRQIEDEFGVDETVEDIVDGILSIFDEDEEEESSDSIFDSDSDDSSSDNSGDFGDGDFGGGGSSDDW